MLLEINILFFHSLVMFVKKYFSSGAIIFIFLHHNLVEFICFQDGY
jgi:hypothetical protein